METSGTLRAEAAPRIGQVNVVVHDLVAAADLLSRLGVEIPAAPGWEAHHRAASTVAAPPSDGHRRVEGPFEVDQLHDRAVAIGGRSLAAPYDAFWGPSLGSARVPARSSSDS